MPSQREQYGGTVHRFIGTGHSPYKITFMPFTFGSNSWASPTVRSTRVRRYLFTHYTPETLLNPVFEDLRKPKAPNSHGQSATAYLRICPMPQLVSRSRARRASSARLDGTASLQNRLCSDRSKLASRDELELAHEPRAIFPALARALASAHL
jgi:hypothetical protein